MAHSTEKQTTIQRTNPYSDLQRAVREVLEEQTPPNEVQERVDDLVQSVHRPERDNVINILRNIFYPLSTLAPNHKLQVGQQKQIRDKQERLSPPKYYSSVYGEP